MKTMQPYSDIPQFLFLGLFYIQVGPFGRRLNLALYSRLAFVDKNVVWVRGGVWKGACLFFNLFSTRLLAEKK